MLASVVSGAVFRFQLEALQPIIASGSGSRPFARFPPSHLRNAARIISSQARLKSNCSAIAEIRFMNSPMRMSEDCISLALRCVDVRRRSRFRPLMTSRPTTPMYIERDVVGSRSLCITFYTVFNTAMFTPFEQSVDERQCNKKFIPL